MHGSMDDGRTAITKAPLAFGANKCVNLSAFIKNFSPIIYHRYQLSITTVTQDDIYSKQDMIITLYAWNYIV